MIFCEECGTKLPEGTAKCPNCGAVVKAANGETDNMEKPADSNTIVAERVQQNSAPQNETGQMANEQPHQYQQQTYAQQPYAQPMYQNYQQPYNYAPNPAYNMPQMHGLVLAEGEVFVRQYQCSYIQSFFH